MQVDEEALQAARAAQQKALEDCTTERCARDHLREAVAGYLSALEARGMVIVPSEPTEGMLKAADARMRAWIPMPTYPGEYDSVLTDAYRAMLASARKGGG